jgi:hypothetical protein
LKKFFKFLVATSTIWKGPSVVGAKSYFFRMLAYCFIPARSQARLGTMEIRFRFDIAVKKETRSDCSI